jgi:DNA-binding transcriptional regulator YdaS (Cro superfamily)
MEKLHAYFAPKERRKGEFADAIGINHAYLSQILSGHRRPSFRLMCEIEKATDGAVKVQDWVADQSVSS